MAAWHTIITHLQKHKIMSDREPMNHNKHNLKVGDIVIADKNYRGGYEVKIISFTPIQMFALVGAPDGSGHPWEIMTNRLSPKITEVNP